MWTDVGHHLSLQLEGLFPPSTYRGRAKLVLDCME